MITLERIHIKFWRAFYKRQRLGAPAGWKTANRGWRWGQCQQLWTRRRLVLGAAGFHVAGNRGQKTEPRSKSAAASAARDDLGHHKGRCGSRGNPLLSPVWRSRLFTFRSGGTGSRYGYGRPPSYGPGEQRSGS